MNTGVQYSHLVSTGADCTREFGQHTNASVWSTQQFHLEKLDLQPASSRLAHSRRAPVFASSFQAGRQSRLNCAGRPAVCLVSLSVSLAALSPQRSGLPLLSCRSKGLRSTDHNRTILKSHTNLSVCSGWPERSEPGVTHSVDQRDHKANLASTPAVLIVYHYTTALAFLWF